MLIHILKKSSFLLIILLFINSLFWQSCKSKSAATTDSSSLINLDSNSQSDTAVYEVPIPDEPKLQPEKPKKERSTSGSSSDNSPEIATDSYIRSDESPKSLCRAAQHKIIQMLYLDAYQKANTNILSEKQNDKGQWTFEVEISWKDRWIKTPYVIKATINTNTNGENTNVQIISKNSEAEVLEFTNKSSKDQANIGNL